MLEYKKLKAFIPTVKPQEAKIFYRDILELDLVIEDGFGMEFNANGTLLRVNFVKELKIQPFTVLGWKVEEISKAIRSLNAKGILCEKYSFLEQDELGIWTSPKGSKVAWFKDPDGNILSFDE